MRLIFKLLLALCVVVNTGLLSAPWAEARPYRCDGRIQTAPCGTVYSQPRRNVYEPEVAAENSVRAMPRDFASGRGGSALPFVSNVSFKRLGQRDAIWRGTVHGRGPVELGLQILRDGMVESVREIGSVVLSERKRSTWFAFKSVFPHGTGWSWQIIAKNMG